MPSTIKPLTHAQQPSGKLLAGTVVALTDWRSQLLEQLLLTVVALTDWRSQLLEQLLLKLSRQSSGKARSFGSSHK